MNLKKSVFAFFAIVFCWCHSTSFGQIENIEQFLFECPNSDPAITQILQDFSIRRNGVLVDTFSCSEPTNLMPISEYTDELIVFQGLRVLYYMDRGQTNHIPWTSGTVYDWLKSQITGLNISDTSSNSYCCETYSDGTYIVIKAQDDINRDFDRYWKGIAGNIGLYVHEARHVDGFPHVSCCGITGGCDQTYDETDLSPYGTQWWLNRAWLTGQINVGYGCFVDTEVEDIANWHLTSCNYGVERFCHNPPPILTMPDQPGGECNSTDCPEPEIVAFAAVPDAVDRGGSAALTWVIEGAVSASILPNVGAVELTDASVTVSPNISTAYTLTASNGCGSVTHTTEVDVDCPIQIVYFTASSNTISFGESVALSWLIDDAATASIDQGIGSVSAQTHEGFNVYPLTTTTYTLTASNECGNSNTASVTVTVIPPEPENYIDGI